MGTWFHRHGASTKKAPPFSLGSQTSSDCGAQREEHPWWNIVHGSDDTGGGGPSCAVKADTPAQAAKTHSWPTPSPVYQVARPGSRELPVGPGVGRPPWAPHLLRGVPRKDIPLLICPPGQVRANSRMFTSTLPGYCQQPHPSQLEPLNTSPLSRVALTQTLPLRRYGFDPSCTKWFHRACRGLGPPKGMPPKH